MESSFDHGSSQPGYCKHSPLGRRRYFASHFGPLLIPGSAFLATKARFARALQECPKPHPYDQDTSFQFSNDPGVTIENYQLPTLPPSPSISHEKTALEQIIKQAESMVSLGRKGIRKISSKSVAFFSKIKRNYQDLRKPRSKISKKEREHMYQDIDIETNVAPPCGTEVQAEGQLGDQLKNCAFALTEDRLYHDYGDYFASKPHMIGRQVRLIFLLHRESEIRWREISEHLGREEAIIEDAKRALEPRPDTPLHDCVERAVDMLNSTMTAEQHLWEINDYASRTSLWYSVTRELIRTGEWHVLAVKIIYDIEALRFAYNLDQLEQKHRMQEAIEEVRDTYFEVCKIGPDGREDFVPKEEMFGIRRSGSEADRESVASVKSSLYSSWTQ